VYRLTWRPPLAGLVAFSYLQFSQIRGRQPYSIVRKIPYLILGINPMRSLSVWVRQIAVGAFSVFVFPLAVDFLKRMAENAGIYDRPGGAAGTVLNFFLSLSQQTWLRVTALTLGAFVTGLVLERRLQKLDRSRTDKRKDLGFEMIKFGNQLRGYTGQLQGEFMHRARRNIVSCFATARKFGIWAPNDRIFSVAPRVLPWT